MPIVDAVKACLAKYADFDGRATRSEYWWFFLAVVLGSAVASLISMRLYALFSLVTFLPRSGSKAVARYESKWLVATSGAGALRGGGAHDLPGAKEHPFEPY